MNNKIDNNIYILHLSLCSKNMMIYREEDILTEVYFSKKDAIKRGKNFFKYSLVYLNSFNMDYKLKDFNSIEFEEFMNFDVYYTFKIDIYPRTIIVDNRLIYEIITDLRNKYKGNILYNSVLSRIHHAEEWYNYKGECVGGIFQSYGTEIYHITEYDFKIKRNNIFKTGDIVKIIDSDEDRYSDVIYRVAWEPTSIYTDNNLSLWHCYYELEACNGNAVKDYMYADDCCSAPRLRLRV